MRAAATPGLPTKREGKGSARARNVSSRWVHPANGSRRPRRRERERERGKRHSKPWLIGFGEGVPPFWRSGRVTVAFYAALFLSFERVDPLHPITSLTSSYVRRPPPSPLLLVRKKRFELRSRGGNFLLIPRREKESLGCLEI